MAINTALVVGGDFVLLVWLQDHDELVRAKEDYEKQLEHQKLALEEQKKRYEEMEV